MVSRSLAARIESMMVVNDASTSGGTISEWYQLTEVAVSRGEGGMERGRERRGPCNIQDILEEDWLVRWND